MGCLGRRQGASSSDSETGFRGEHSCCSCKDGTLSIICYEIDLSDACEISQTCPVVICWWSSLALEPSGRDAHTFNDLIGSSLIDDDKVERNAIAKLQKINHIR